MAHSNAGLVDQICGVLSQSGFEKEVCWSSHEVLPKSDKMPPDTVIYGVGIKNAFEDVSKLRDRILAPIIVTGSYPPAEGWIKAVDAGADAYLKEPLSLGELVARLKSILRRYHQRVIMAGSLAIDLEHRRALLEGSLLDLSSTEFALLSLLIQNQGRVVSRIEITRRIWKCDHNCISPRIVDVYISRLRRKIKDGPSQPYNLVSIRRVGYMFKNQGLYSAFEGGGPNAIILG